MTISTRILLTLAGAMLLYMGLVEASSRLIIQPSFEELELAEANKDLQRARDALLNEVEHLDLLNRDWGAWDDTYAFAQGQNEGFREENLVSEATYTNNGLSVLLVYDVKGQRVGGTAWDHAAGGPTTLSQFGDTLPAGHPLLAHFQGPGELSERRVAGVMETDLGPMLVSSRPILTGENEGPSAGAILMGRLVDAEMTRRIAAQAHLDLSIHDLAAGAEAPAEMEVQDEALLVATVLEDLGGAPILSVQVAAPRDISARGAGARRAASLSVLVGGVFLAALVVLLLRSSVIRPLEQLTRHAVLVGQHNDLLARIDMRRDDEIGGLATAFNQMVERVDDARKAMLDQSYEAGRSATVAGVLHNVRNMLSPIVFKLDRVTQSFAEGDLLARLDMAMNEVESPHTPPERRQALERYRTLATRRLMDAVGSSLQDIEDTRQRIARVEEVLSLSQQDGRKVQPLEPVRPHSLLEEAVRLVPDELLRFGAVQVDPGAAELAPVVLSRIHLLQIVANLVQNALEAARDSGRPDTSVTAAARLESAATGLTLHVSVEDDGPGVPAESRTSIFQRGFTTKGRDNQGLGLHWCANAVTAMGGRLVLSSRPGPGAQFVMSLPVTPVRPGA